LLQVSSKSFVACNHQWMFMWALGTDCLHTSALGNAPMQLL
jgi:hypothetical protein